MSVMLEAVERVPREAWRREVLQNRETVVSRVVQALERLSECRIWQSPTECAAKLRTVKEVNPEAKQMIAKLQSSLVNPKSVPGLLLALMIKMSQIKERKSTAEMDKAREELARAECL